MNFIAPLLCGQIHIPQGPLFECKEAHVSLTEKDSYFTAGSKHKVLPLSKPKYGEESFSSFSEKDEMVCIA